MSNIYYDFDTSNKSFLDVHEHLKKIGVQNNKFMLSLHDERLIGFDPYDKNVTFGDMEKVYNECVVNPWYFLREICRVPGEYGSNECKRYTLDLNGLATWYLFKNGIDSCSAKPRVLGNQDALIQYFYAKTFGTYDTALLIIGDDEGIRDTIDHYYKYIPFCLSSNAFSNDLAKTNPSDEILMPTYYLGDSTDICSRILRYKGIVSGIQLFWNFDNIPNNVDIFNELSFGYAKESQRLRKKGLLYGRILTSVPLNPLLKKAAAANAFINNMVRWDDLYFDASFGELHDKLERDASVNVFYVENTWKSLGRSQEWYDSMCNVFCGHADDICRDIDIIRDKPKV